VIIDGKQISADTPERGSHMIFLENLSHELRRKMRTGKQISHRAARCVFSWYGRQAGIGDGLCAACWCEHSGVLVASRILETRNWRLEEVAPCCCIICPGRVRGN
jgi:hypothetical protein